MNIEYKITPNKHLITLTQHPVLVLHSTLGAYRGAVDWLTNPRSNVSAHAVFGRHRGEVTQLADSRYACWHAGRVNNPTERAKAVLPKNIFGKLKNPNASTFGLEFAGGYDIDRDGVIEPWEQKLNQNQIEDGVEYVLDELEPDILKRHNMKVKFKDVYTITHQDITADKPDIQHSRDLFVATLAKRRAERERGTPAMYINPLASFGTKELVTEMMTRPKWVDILMGELKNKK